MPAAREVEIRFTGDTTDLEERLERCLALAERFKEVWGDAPRPDGLERLEVKPGDVIVLRCDAHLSAVEADRIKHAAEGWFPGTTAVVLAAGLRIETVLGGN